MFSPDFETERESLAFFAWQHIRHRQHDLTPGEGIPWLEWFKRRYRDELAAVRARLEGE